MNKYILAGLMSISFGSLALTSCSDVEDPVINTTPIVKEVTTGGASVTATSATVTGTVAGISGQSTSAYTVGVVYSTSENPLAGGSRAVGSLGEDGKTVTTTINGLTDGVTYYYAQFVTLQGTLTTYGEVKSFVTTDSEIATAAPAAVTAVSANLGGTLNGVQDKLEAGSLEYGVVIAPKGKDLAADGVKFPAEGTDNAFTVAVDALVPNTAYDYAAYMMLNGAIVVGDTKVLQTPVGIDANAESVDDYVDMGTRLEWCKYNVGSMSETVAGTLLGYGDITGLTYTTNLADYAAGSITGTARDAAVASGMGLTPTEADWAELMAVSTLEATTIDGVAGVTVTSTVTGNSIFLPAAGKREGTSVDAADLAYYWTGNASAINSDYATIAAVSASGVEMASAMRYTGALVRPVRKPFINELEVDVNKLVVGDLENNGRVRIEIYNEFGKTANDPAVDLASVSFDHLMVAEFTLEGVKDNLKADAAGSYRAGFEFAAAGWSPDYWSSFDGNWKDCLIVGDGTYRVAVATTSPSNGAVVFCIDISGLGADIVDMELVKVTSMKLMFDPKQPMYADVDTSSNQIWLGNKEDNGKDIRMEFYNEYGPTGGSGDPFAGVIFGMGTTVANVTIEGVDGNLKAGAAGSYSGAMSLACAGWNPSWWGGGASQTTFGSDGTYNFPAYLSENGTGTVVWCIDIAGLFEDLVDPSLLKMTVNSVVTPVVDAE